MSFHSVAVFRSPQFKGSSRNGITERQDRVMLYTGKLEDLSPQNQRREDLLVLKEVQLGDGTKFKYATPALYLLKKLNSMMGGAFIYSPDSRFTSDVSRYPVPVMDRLEDVTIRRSRND